MVLSRLDCSDDLVLKNLKIAKINSTPIKSFKDPLYGSIQIDAQALAIIDTPEFQRLRFIKQTGLVYLLYPSAHHTRFEHSIGCYHLACNLLETISTHQQSVVEQKDLGLVSVAALIHDLGHGPFSHSFDDILKRMNAFKESHEERSIRILRFMNEKYDFGIEEDDIQIISALIQGKSLNRKKNYLYQIVSNSDFEIDVDKLDYLLRDAYLTTNLSITDVSRIIGKVKVFSNEGNLCGLDDNSASTLAYAKNMDIDLTNVLWNRYSNFQQIYCHKTSLILTQMVEDAIILANTHFKWHEMVTDIDLFCTLDDTILREIERCRSDSEEIKKAKEILSRIFNRDLYKFVHHSVIPTDQAAVLQAKISSILNKYPSEDYRLISTKLTLNKANDQVDLVKQNVWFWSRNGTTFTATKNSPSTFLMKADLKRETHFWVFSTNENIPLITEIAHKLQDEIDLLRDELNEISIESTPTPKINLNSRSRTNEVSKTPPLPSKSYSIDLSSPLPTLPPLKNSVKNN